MPRRWIVFAAVGFALLFTHFAGPSAVCWGTPQDDQAKKAAADQAKKAQDDKDKKTKEDQARKAQQDQAKKTAADQAQKAQQDQALKAQQQQAQALKSQQDQALKIQQDQAAKAAADKARQDQQARDKQAQADKDKKAQQDAAQKAQADRAQKAKEEQLRKQQELDTARRQQLDQAARNDQERQRLIDIDRAQRDRELQLRQQQDAQRARDEQDRLRRLQDEQNRASAQQPAIDPSAPPFRTWSDPSGTFRLEAKYVDLTEGVVHLKKHDGTTVPAPIERLSEADQDYVGQQPGAYPITISWQAAPSDPVALEAAPAIVYHNTRGQALNDVRVVGRFKPQATGRYVLLAAPNHTPLAKDDAEPLASDTWTKPIAPALTTISTRGNGTLRVALFKASGKNRPLPADQLSNWLEMPLEVK